MDLAEEIAIVIVGGGIAGLATALALHRKGIKSVVLERSEYLRSSGAAIGILTNGWRALDHLGIASDLRLTALRIQGIRDEWLQTGIQQESPISVGEARCLKRSDLITTFVNNLPQGTIRLGCEIISIHLDKLTSYPVLQLHNGTTIKAKILIGCDGANSVVADFIELKPPKLFYLWAIRGYSYYPNGHGFETKFTRLRAQNFVGIIPIDDKSVYWFILQRGYPQDTNFSKDPKQIKQLSLKSITDCPKQVNEMVENCNLESLSLTQLRYRAPWDILLNPFRKGTVTVAGDAMHVMGPFLGQGGSAAIEDAIVLVRCLAPVMNQIESQGITKGAEIGDALDQYVKERRRRLVGLSTQTFIMGMLHQTSSLILKFACICFRKLLFRDFIYSTRYDCGRL